MEILSADWLSSLLAIVLIDLVLAGDNAIVIALAARQLPVELRTRAIVWGTVGAIGVRMLMTFGVVWLLKLPGLMLVGGLGLVWIAFRLLVSEDNDEHIAPATTFWAAMRTIIVADALMGIDNVLGVAGAAQGSLLLVAIGLAISVPIVVWGSTLALGMIERFPILVDLGAAVLAFTAARMIVNEPWVEPFFEANPVWRIALEAALVASVLITGRVLARNRAKSAAPHD